MDLQELLEQDEVVESVVTESMAAPMPQIIAPWIALALALVSKALMLPALLFEGCRIWLHEFGHAFIAWFGSRAATPLGIGWTSIGESKSWYVYACFLFLIGVTALRAYKSRCYFILFLTALAFIGQTNFSLLSNAYRWERMFVYGGVGGEFYLSALMILSFHFYGPQKLRWDFLRYIFLAVGMYVFIESIRHWLRIHKGIDPLPLGTLIRGEDDQGGDMNRLMDEFGFSRQEIIASYLMDGWRLTALIGMNYLVQLFRFLPKLKSQS